MTHLQKTAMILMALFSMVGNAKEQTLTCQGKDLSISRADYDGYRETISGLITPGKSVLSVRCKGGAFPFFFDVTKLVDDVKYPITARDQAVSLDIYLLRDEQVGIAISGANMNRLREYLAMFLTAKSSNLTVVIEHDSYLTSMARGDEGHPKGYRLKTVTLE